MLLHSLCEEQLIVLSAMMMELVLEPLNCVLLFYGDTWISERWGKLLNRSGNLEEGVLICTNADLLDGNGRGYASMAR